MNGLLLNKMAGELKSVTGDTEIAGWMMWIPGIHNIMAMIKVHPLMERARQMRGIQTPAKPNWMYLIIPTFAVVRLPVRSQRSGLSSSVTQHVGLFCESRRGLLFCVVDLWSNVISNGRR